MKSGLTVTKDLTKELDRALKGLVEKRVLVGIPAENAQRQPDPDDSQPLSNAAIGYLMETGSPAANIPARPFLEPGVRDAADEIQRRLSATAKAALDGDASAVDKGLTAVGLVAEAAVKRRITEGSFEPLAPATLKARKARGRTSEKPLLDTGQLRNVVTHVIRRAT
jgi:phage gpG-like protein